MIKLKLLIIFFLLLIIPVSRIFAQETTVTVSGRVFDKVTNQPVGAGLTVDTCPLNGRSNPVISQDGVFSFTVPRWTSFCVRGIVSLGYSSFLATNKTATSSDINTYEWQVAGVNCNADTVEGVPCGSSKTEDRAIDTGYDLAYSPLVTISGKVFNKTTQQPYGAGQALDTCPLNGRTNPVIGADGTFSFTVPKWTSFCVRGIPSIGYAKFNAINKTSTSTTSFTYEWQVAGINCNAEKVEGIPCGSSKLEDRAVDTGFDLDYTGANSSPGQSPPPSSNPSSNPSSPPGDTLTESYRLADSESGLDAASFQPYNQEPLITNFTLSDGTPGFKQIWVEFKSTTGETRKEHLSIELVNTAPTINSLSCTVDLSRQNLKVEVVGINLGNRGGKLMSDDTNLDVLEWKDNSVTGILKKPSLPTDDTQTFNIKLKTQNDVDLPPVPCRVDTSMIALGAKIFCRDQGNFEVPNVKVTLKDQNDTKAEETVTIDKNGSISGLKSKLQAGKVYLLSIKAPHSLRRNAFFKATTGTTVATNQDGSPFILPIGDIAPVNGPDGTINTADRAVLTQQWLSSKSASKNLSADFNNDQRVNSFDWACMRYDFGKSDDKKADSVSLTCGKPPVCGGTLETGDPSPNDPLQCPQYSCKTKEKESEFPSEPTPTPTPSSQQISFTTQPTLGTITQTQAQISFKTNICPTNAIIICDGSFGSATLPLNCNNGTTQTTVDNLTSKNNYTCSIGVFSGDSSAANSDNFTINTP